MAIHNEDETNVGEGTSDAVGIPPAGAPLEAWACALAQRRLESQQPRWAHVQGVIARARRIRRAAGADGDLLVAAAALHDVGHARDLALTGFPPLDGARFLQRIGAPRRLVELTANFTAARVDAGMLGFADELAEFHDERTPVRDALWFCDLMTGPDGAPMTFEQRCADVRERYGPGSVADRAMLAAHRDMLAAIHRTEIRLGIWP